MLFMSQNNLSCGVLLVGLQSGLLNGALENYGACKQMGELVSRFLNQLVGSVAKIYPAPR